VQQTNPGEANDTRLLSAVWTFEQPSLLNNRCMTRT